jgi:antirestriction protein
MDTPTDQDTPQAWVGCLGCYNAGMLVGRWVEGIEAGDVTVESLHSERGSDILQADLYASTHEELWVMDFQGYSGFLTRECSPMEAQRIAEVIQAIEADGADVGAVGAYVDNIRATFETWDDLKDDFEEAYAGEWSSEQDFAQNLAEDLGAIDQNATWPNDCIDWERATRELFTDYWSAEAPGGMVWVFRS